MLAAQRRLIAPRRSRTRRRTWRCGRARTRERIRLELTSRCACMRDLLDGVADAGLRHAGASTSTSIPGQRDQRIGIIGDERRAAMERVAERCRGVCSAAIRRSRADLRKREVEVGDADDMPYLRSGAHGRGNIVPNFPARSRPTAPAGQRASARATGPGDSREISSANISLLGDDLTVAGGEQRLLAHRARDEGLSGIRQGRLRPLEPTRRGTTWRRGDVDRTPGRQNALSTGTARRSRRAVGRDHSRDRAAPGSRTTFA